MRIGSKLLICVCICVFLTILLATGAAYALPQKGGTLKVALSTMPSTLDAQQSGDMITRQIAMHIFESLVTMDENYDIIPELAESWTMSDDGSEYTFKLRKGVLFHNGDEMKADDVIASVERWLKVSRRKGELNMIKEMVNIDDYTVKFILTSSSGSFLPVLAIPRAQLAILPKEIVKDAPAKEVDIIGTGPYKLEEWIGDRYVHLTRFEEYQPVDFEASGLGGNKVAYIDEIYFYSVPEPTARVAGLETGEYDFADLVLPNLAEELKSNSKLNVVKIGPYAAVNFWINNNLAPTDNLLIRKAIQSALKHDDIMIAATDASYRLDSSWFFEEQIWHSDSGKEYFNTYDPEKAKAYLKEAGYKGEKIKLVTNTDYDVCYKSSLVISEQLKAIGLNVELSVYDWPTTVDIAYNQPEEWHLFFVFMTTLFDPVQPTKANVPGAGPGSSHDPRLTELADKLEKAVDFEQRYKIWSNIQELLYDDVIKPKIGDWFIYQSYNDSLKNYKPWYGTIFWNTWIE